jgi:hypothetical protein
MHRFKRKAIDQIYNPPPSSDISYVGAQCLDASELVPKLAVVEKLHDRLTLVEDRDVSRVRNESEKRKPDDDKTNIES